MPSSGRPANSALLNTAHAGELLSRNGAQKWRSTRLGSLRLTGDTFHAGPTRMNATSASATAVIIPKATIQPRGEACCGGSAVEGGTASGGAVAGCTLSP